MSKGFNIRLSDEDRFIWKEMAKDTHGGNVSAFVKFCVDKEVVSRNTVVVSTEDDWTEQNQKMDGIESVGKAIDVLIEEPEGVGNSISAPPTVSPSECPRIKLHRRGVYCKVCKVVDRDSARGSALR